jgi:hypothetical protein
LFTTEGRAVIGWRSADRYRAKATSFSDQLASLQDLEALHHVYLPFIRETGLVDLLALKG